VRIPHRRYEL
jgi:hypothetical protein